MINAEMFPKAYKEVLEIIKYIPKEDYEKIPENIINNMEQEMDNEYEYEIDCLDNFEKQKMLKETETILAIFFRDYCATQEQREKILIKEKYDRQKNEKQKEERYNSNDLFKQTDNNKENKGESNKNIIVYKKSFLQTLFNFLRNLLKNNNYKRFIRLGRNKKQ